MLRILVFDTDLYLYVWRRLGDFLDGWEPGMWDEIVLVVDEDGNRYHVSLSGGRLRAIPEGAPMGSSALLDLVKHHIDRYTKLLPQQKSSLSQMLDLVQADQ